MTESAGQCCWCGKPKSEHGPNPDSIDPQGLSCPVAGRTSQFYTPKFKPPENLGDELERRLERFKCLCTDTGDQIWINADIMQRLWRQYKARVEELERERDGLQAEKDSWFKEWKAIVGWCGGNPTEAAKKAAERIFEILSHWRTVQERSGQRHFHVSSIDAPAIAEVIDVHYRGIEAKAQQANAELTRRVEAMERLYRAARTDLKVARHITGAANSWARFDAETDANIQAAKASGE